jgi:arylsulfatase A-like enzyme
VVGHGYHVYDDLIRVPLLLIGKDLFPEGMELDAQVSHTDVMPTLLQAFQMSCLHPDQLIGQSILSWLQKGPDRDHVAYTMACGMDIFEKDQWLEGIRCGGYKYVQPIYNSHIAPELYHLSSDPGERNNLAAGEADIAVELQKRLQTLKEKGQMPLEKLSEAEDAEIRKRLRSLGYLH